MAQTITADNISSAWLQAASFLMSNGSRHSNLIACISNPLEELPEIRRALDGFYQRHRKRGVGVVSDVADTLFPSDLYDSEEPNSADLLFERRKTARHFQQQSVPNGNYFDRLCAYPGKKHEVNQIERVLTRLRRAKAKGVSNLSNCELAISDVAEDCGDELRIQEPSIDNSTMGFPCLSQISVTLDKGRVELTALYRSQDFTLKAYGNYVGLGRLCSFLAIESGFDLGEVVCVATCATLPTHGFGPDGIREAVKNCLKLTGD